MMVQDGAACNITIFNEYCKDSSTGEPCKTAVCQIKMETPHMIPFYQVHIDSNET